MDMEAHTLLYSLELGEVNWNLMNSPNSIQTA